MSQSAPPEAPHIPDDPSRRTGTEDPFNPLDPDDPLGLDPPPDPFLPGQPDPDPTWSGGVLTPPDIPPVTGANPPAGHAALLASIGKLPPLPTRVKGLQEGADLTLFRIAQRGRNSLADHWALLKQTALARLDQRLSVVNDAAERARQTDLVKVLGTDGPAAAALDQWCQLRDAVPVDEAKLSAAIDNLSVAVGQLRSDLALGEGVTGVGKVRAGLTEALGGFLSEVTSEAGQVAAGESVPRGKPSDLLTWHLESSTRDRNWRDRLSREASWKDAGDTLTKAIGASSLKKPISKRMGTVDVTTMTQRLSVLDAKLRSRDQATKAAVASGSRVDYQVRNDALQGYLGVADSLNTQLKLLRDGYDALSTPDAKGWTRAQAQNAVDLVVGMVRSLGDQIAADPLVQDPDLASGTRSLLTRLDLIAGKTSLDQLADKYGTDLRKAWKTAKNIELAALKAADEDAKSLKALKGMFDQGLGPVLDNWTTAVSTFPGHDRTTVKDLTTQAITLLARYRTAVLEIVGAKSGSGLVIGLDAIALAISNRIRSYDGRGGLL